MDKDDTTHDSERATADRDLPRADVRKRSWWTWLWAVPVLAAVYLGFLVYSSSNHGPRITIEFHDAGGMSAGKTPIKFRGVQVGTVESVTVSADDSHVTITAKLLESAASLARKGSAFWIVRPQVSMSGIRGLRTIVAGDYIQVKPGDGPPASHFNGLETPPVIESEDGGLRVELIAGSVGSVQKGSPLLYRGLQVGEVVGMHLGDDSQTVRFAVRVQPHYAELVRRDSKFWNVGNPRLDVSLFGGAEFGARSIGMLLTGGIAFATPDPPGEPADNATAFRLYEQADPSWLQWAPDVRLGPRPGDGGPHDAK